jgi:hypothetical protein
LVRHSATGNDPLSRLLYIAIRRLLKRMNSANSIYIDINWELNHTNRPEIAILGYTDCRIIASNGSQF